MENIFENAYFGKLYKTRDGRKAIYTIMSCDSHWLAIQDTSFTCEYNNQGKLVSNIGNVMDIVSEWQEEIDEEELEKLADEESLWLADAPLQERRFKEGYKAGYHKAKGYELRLA